MIYSYGSKDSPVLGLGIGEDSMQYEYNARCDPPECRL